MRAIQVKQYVKGPSELTVSELPDPIPAADEYLVAIHASATNFFDLLQIQGKYQLQPPLPWVAGFEFAGTILQTPQATKSRSPRFAVGDRVFGAGQGGYATKTTAKEGFLRPIPQGWDFVDAAGLFVTAPTSYAALVTRADIKRGDYVLVHAAAGGVGLAAVQIAKALGAVVIATASTPAKLDIAKSYGADHVVCYHSSQNHRKAGSPPSPSTPSQPKSSALSTTSSKKPSKPKRNEPSWPDEVLSLTPSRRGVDIVFDPVGLITPSLKCTAWNGRLVVVGFAAGAIEKVAMNRVLLKNVSVTGLHWGQYARHEPQTVETVWRELFKLMESGKFKGTAFKPGIVSEGKGKGEGEGDKASSTPSPSSISKKNDDGKEEVPYVGLNSIPEALRALGARETWGKVVVRVPQDDDAQTPQGVKSKL
ncbi:NAD(P)-binding protein [Xylona heveae TC161]|uniref:NAD(P)-binding protein n=1 Tax=Xylona heveae (strain CBS 132557 / TC161) TaxID=1328760 RepID=A0A161TPS0_XYLHT|nr:NAD(P)-binding protein [Xylona heveae TC161]KZF24246.1 NAD(P)-binding protein [Xylona heveae TC161]